MTECVAFSVGNIDAIDKTGSTLGGYFEKVFGGIEGKSHDFIPLVKLLKNFLASLTVAVVCPEKGFQFRVLTNAGAEIRSIFGSSIDRYRDKSLELRW